MIHEFLVFDFIHNLRSILPDPLFIAFEKLDYMRVCLLSVYLNENQLFGTILTHIDFYLKF